jgi:hypothetical protein
MPWPSLREGPIGTRHLYADFTADPATSNVTKSDFRHLRRDRCCTSLLIAPVDLRRIACADLVEIAGVLRRLPTSKPDTCMRTISDHQKSMQNAPNARCPVDHWGVIVLFVQFLAA